MAKCNCEKLRREIAEMKAEHDDKNAVIIREAHRRKDGTYHIGKIISRQG